MPVAPIAAAAVGKRLSKKGRANAKDKRADRQDKRADRKEARAKRLEGRGKAGKASIVRAKANVKSEKSKENRRKSNNLKKKIAEGKTIKGRLQKAGKMVSDKVKEKGGVKEIAKNLASKTPAGKIAKKIKDNKPKRDALKKERQASRERKRAIRKDKDLTSKATQSRAPKTSAADQMAEKTMKKVDVKKEKKAAPVVAGAPGMYDSMGQGMPYYKGKISYGHNSGMKMSGYAKAGLAGKGLSMNSQQKISRHMSSAMYKKNK